VSAFPGKREEANRTGITPRTLVRTIDLIIAGGGGGKMIFWPRMNADKKLRLGTELRFN
jgi:hypothetical protein